MNRCKRVCRGLCICSHKPIFCSSISEYFLLSLENSPQLTSVKSELLKAKITIQWRMGSVAQSYAPNQCSDTVVWGKKNLGVRDLSCFGDRNPSPSKTKLCARQGWSLPLLPVFSIRISFPHWNNRKKACHSILHWGAGSGQRSTTDFPHPLFKCCFSGDLTPMVEEDFTLTLDTFLHVQQLRKKRLRAFCRQSGKVTALPRSQEERAHLLSSLRVSTKLDLLYCRVPSTGVEEWQQLLEKLEEKENLTLPVPLPYPRQHASETQLSEFNLTEIEAMLGSYTKVLFVRDPFQRLISTFLQGTSSSPSFRSFVQDVLDSGQHNDSMAWKPLVGLCQPCLIQYDYVVMFGFLRQELGHLLRRAGLPVDSLLPKFSDTQVQWTYSWLSEQMFSELSLQQKKQLSYFYRWDLVAFPFSSSFLSDLLSTPETW